LTYYKELIAIGRTDPYRKRPVFRERKVSDVARYRFTAAIIEERIPCTPAYLDGIDKNERNPPSIQGLISRPGK
jgi:hypothetical protein